MRMLKAKRSKTNLDRHGLVFWFGTPSGWNRCFGYPFTLPYNGVAPTPFLLFLSWWSISRWILLVYPYWYICTFTSSL